MQTELNQVTIAQAKKLIIEALTNFVVTPPNIMLHGSMGLGKSSIVQQAAKETGYNLVDLRGSAMEASDVQGIPYVVDGEMRFSTPSWWPEDGVKTVIFLDEITNCSTSVQHAFYRLILDRSIQNGKKLGNEVAIIAAGNLRSDKTGARDLVPAANNRFAMHLVIDSNRAADSFLSWGMSNGIHRSITGFLSWKNDEVFRAPANGEVAFPTPRSWEAASNLMKLHKGSESDLSIKMASAVGSQSAIQLMGFIEYNQYLPDWERLYEDESYSYEMPKDDTAMVYALSVALAIETLDAIAEDSEDKVNKLTTLVGHLDKEIKTVYFRTLKRIPELAYKFVHYDGLVKEFETVSKYIK